MLSVAGGGCRGRSNPFYRTDRAGLSSAPDPVDGVADKNRINARPGLISRAWLATSVMFCRIGFGRWTSIRCRCFRPGAARGRFGCCSVSAGGGERRWWTCMSWRRPAVASRRSACQRPTGRSCGRPSARSAIPPVSLRFPVAIGAVTRMRSASTTPHGRSHSRNGGPGSLPPSGRRPGSITLAPPLCRALPPSRSSTS